MNLGERRGGKELAVEGRQTVFGTYCMKEKSTSVEKKKESKIMHQGSNPYWLTKDPLLIY